MHNKNKDNLIIIFTGSSNRQNESGYQFIDFVLFLDACKCDGKSSSAGSSSYCYK
jgi:hypothetical protein